MRSSKYPSTWKLVEVIPLHKDGDHEVASNNRPISLLAALSKVCDKVVLNQFTAFKLLSNNQSGNRKDHSTETLNEAMDKKQTSIVIFIDLSKAFDIIEHHTLIGKISRLGVWPAVYEWFRSYLAYRSQYVRI